MGNTTEILRECHTYLVRARGEGHVKAEMEKWTDDLISELEQSILDTSPGEDLGT